MNEYRIPKEERDKFHDMLSVHVEIRKRFSSDNDGLELYTEYMRKEDNQRPIVIRIEEIPDE